MRETKTRLSVVIPVHRAEAYLAECLDSVLLYEEDDMEVIVVDDASPDGCSSILEAYAATDTRLRPVSLTENVGLGGARNAGLEGARGEYVWFVDADDWLPEDAIRVALDRLAVTRPDVLLVDHAEVFPDGSAVRRTSAPLVAGLTMPIRLVKQPELLRLSQSACTKVVRRRFLDEIGLRFRPGLYEDSAYSHPLLMAAEKIDVLNRVLYHYRQQTPGAITATPSERHFEVFDQYEHVFGIVEAASTAYEGFRPELFRAMLSHYLVIIGTYWRLPAGTRRRFFQKMVEHYRRFLPPGGYHAPPGFDGLKHRLVSHNAYAAYAALRLIRKATTPRQRHHGTGNTSWSIPRQRSRKKEHIGQDATGSRIV